jgi:hypothetical protein
MNLHALSVHHYCAITSNVFGHQYRFAMLCSARFWFYFVLATESRVNCQVESCFSPSVSNFLLELFPVTPLIFTLLYRPYLLIFHSPLFNEPQDFLGGGTRS